MGDAALAARDAKARKSEAVVAAVDNFDLSALFEAPARIENAIPRNGTDPQIVEYEDDDNDNYEEDVDWYTGCLFCLGDDSHRRDARRSHHCEHRRDAETAH